jgi:hypothetical protein
MERGSTGVITTLGGSGWVTVEVLKVKLSSRKKSSMSWCEG